MAARWQAAGSKHEHRRTGRQMWTRESRTEEGHGRTGTGTDRETHGHVARHGSHRSAGPCMLPHSPRTSVGASGTNLI